MQGYVKFYNTEKKFGFIRIHADVGDLFFDGQQVIGEPIKWGDTVEYWIGDSRIPGRGLVAVDVKRVCR